MRSTLLTGLIAAQIATAPAVAADLPEDRSMVMTESGSFAGARLRLSLGGAPRRDRLRAGLVMAPVVRAERMDGGALTRFGEGLEIGVAGHRRVALSLAGRPLTGQDDRASSEPRAGVSTIGWIAIGVGALAVTVLALGVACQETNCLNSE